MGEQNDWLNQLTKEYEDAGGFYDELVSHDGWWATVIFGLLSFFPESPSGR